MAPMAPRRSSRLQAQVTAEPTNPPQVQVQNPPSRKRETPATKGDASGELEEKEVKLIKAPVAKKAAKKKAIAVPDQPDLGVGDDVLSKLPPEILGMILDNVTDKVSISSLSRASKRYYSLMGPRLHKRIAVTAMFHAHIQKLIRAVEPHLSISQKKFLKKQGKYKGQQEQYSRGLDENKVPECASFVRQMIIGVCDPGRKHEYIVQLYMDEAFKNMKNLEIVETLLLTKSMAQSLASMKHLQALSINMIKFETETEPWLKKVKGLKHLSFEEHGFDSFEDNDALLDMIMNSRQTLQSLVLRQTRFGANLFDWSKKATASRKTSVANATDGCDFPVLTSLTLRGTRLNANLVQSMTQSIDFMQLQELRFEYLGDDDAILFDQLATLPASASNGITLRKLYVDLSDNELESTGLQGTNIESKIRFVSSFDTLTSLELHDYNQHKLNIPGNPGIPDSIIQAILKHKNLKTLNFGYRGLISGCKVPFLSASTLATICDNLPDLEEINFSPDLDDLDEIGRVLARCPNLVSITCYPDDKPGFPPQPSPTEKLLKSILEAFISNDGGGKSKEKFVWERQTKLKKVSVVYRKWEIASKFGKPPKGAKKPETYTSKNDNTRKVMFMDVTSTIPLSINVGFDLQHPWVEKVLGTVT